MKKLLAVSALALITLTAQAQNPPPPLSNCATNCTIVFTDPGVSAYCNDPTQRSNYFGGMGWVNTSIFCHFDEGEVFYVSTSGCSATETIIGYAYLECDPLRTCPSGQQGGGQEQCGPSDAAMIRMPAGYNEILVSFRTYLCCHIEVCVQPVTQCSPPAGGQIPPQP